MKTIARVAGLLLCVVCTGGMGEIMARSLESYRAKLKDINLADGVSKEEAMIIAQNNLIDDGTDKFCVLSRPSVGDSDSPVDGAGRPLGPCWTVSFNATWTMRLKSGLKWFIVYLSSANFKLRT